MTTIDGIATPALLLDLDVLESNLRRMNDRARRLGVALRPHVKTHKCFEVARMQRSLGATGITVSTLHEAEVFADHGFDDITWAFPIVPCRLEQARRLGERVRLGLLVDSADAVGVLERSGYPFAVWLKVDCGFHRAGVDPDSPAALDLARSLRDSRVLRFAGILTHSGHAYRARSPREILAVADEERRVMVELAGRLREHGIDVPSVSVGSTPATSVVESLEGVSEVRPGNYALHDHTQTVLGSCAPSDCAATVLASVVSSSAARGESIVDAGALALSKDPGPAHAPVPTMGEIFEDYRSGKLDAGLRLTRITQEHGVASEALAVGSKVRILPNHSCLTAACFDEYHVVRGDEVVDRWKIWRGR